MIRSPHGTRAMRGAPTCNPPERVLRAGPRRPGGGGEGGALLPPLLQGYDEGLLRAAGAVPGYCPVFESPETLARAGVWLTAAAERPGVARVRFLTVLPADSANPNLALEQVRHIGDDGVLAEQERALDEQGRLVVHDVLPPPPREELGQDDRDHLLVAARLDLVDVVEQRAQERSVRRRQDDQGNPESPLGPLLLDFCRARRVRLHEDRAHRGGRCERLRVLHGAHDPAVDVSDGDEHGVLELGRSLEAFERELGGDLVVVAAHGHEDADQERNHDDDNPGPLAELRDREGQEDDTGHDRANPVDPHAPAPTSLPQLEPAPYHAAL